MPRLVIKALVDPYHSYGQLLFEIFAGLIQRGVEVAIRPIEVKNEHAVPFIIKDHFVVGPQEEEWELLLAPLGNCVRPTPGKSTLYFSMWETDRVGPQQIGVLNRAQVVITPSTWGQKVMGECGLLAESHVVPLGVSPEIFSYRPPVAGPTTFAVAGRYMSAARKNPGVIIQAFQKAFGKDKDVRLAIKTYPDDPLRLEADNIVVSKAYWPWDQLLRWMINATAFVHCAHEGWGLMQHQAMALGRPVIGPLWGSVADFVTPANSYPVKFDLAPADDDFFQFISGGSWPTMDVDDLARAMREVHENRVACEFKGQTASSNVSHLTWDNTTQRLLEVLVKTGVSL